MNKYTEDFTSITLDIQDKITAAVNELGCEPILICRLTNHPEDDHLYVVIGQYIEPRPFCGKAYCVWTANVNRRSAMAELYYGNYDVSFKNALKIVDEKVRDLNKEEF